MAAAIRVAGLVVLWLGLAVAASALVVAATPSEPAAQGRPLPLLDLQRRADGLARAAENLFTLLEGHREGRLDRAELASYLRERAKLLKELAKDIQRDPSVRQIAWIKRRGPKLTMPEKPRSLEEAGPLIELAVQDAKLLQKEIEEIGRDSDSPEVSLEELARPSPAALCRRIRKTAEILEDFAKSLENG